MGIEIIVSNEGNGGERKVKRRNKVSVKSSNDPRIKSGRWTDSERRIFLRGLKQFGRGKWKEIATLIPTRSTVQVKTHAQMVMKRVENGDDVFAEFQESWISKGQQENRISVLHGFAVNTKSRAVPHPAMDTLKMYDSLSQKDQGAVHILYQMTHN